MVGVASKGFQAEELGASWSLRKGKEGSRERARIGGQGGNWAR